MARLFLREGRRRRIGNYNQRNRLTRGLLPAVLLIFCISTLPLAAPIHDAVESGDIVRVRELLGSGVSVAAQDEAGNTPLHWAAVHGDPTLVGFLLDAVAPVNATNDLHVTPLILAVYKMNYDADRLLASRGADPNIRDSDKTTALSLAVDYGQWDLVQHFILSGADPNLPDDKGVSPLARVTKDVGPTMVQWLVEHGAKVNVRDRAGMTPLHHAADWEQPEIVHYLIQHGADVNAQSNNSLTPLYYGILSGRIEIVKFLLDAGADANSIWRAGKWYPNSPLEFAHTFHDKDFGNKVAGLLLAHGARILAETVACISAAQIERINGFNAQDRIAHVQGQAALIYVLLDPVWSRPEFDDVPYRQDDDIAALKSQLKKLVDAGIDEVIVWKLPRFVLGAAVPFQNGCAVDEYGEPDHLEKLRAMHKAYILISEHGADDPSIEDAIEKILWADGYGVYGPLGGKIGTIIDKIRPLAPYMKPAQPPRTSTDLWFH